VSTIRERLKSLSLSEALGIAAVVAFLSTATLAVLRSTPMLQSSSVSVDDRVFPVSYDAASSLRFDAETFRVQLSEQPGCVELHALQGKSEVCNRHLHCADRPPKVWAFEVFRSGADAFYVETGSQCNSACCDFRGTTISSRGQRLDDTWPQRVLTRLGYVGLGALGLGIYGFVRRGRGLLARSAGIVGFALATALLWWNL